MNYKNEKKTDLKKILNKELIDFLNKDAVNADIKYDFVFDDKGLHFTTIIHQFISLENVNILNRNVRDTAKRGGDIGNKFDTGKKKLKIEEELNEDFRKEVTPVSDSFEDLHSEEDAMSKSKLSESETKICDMILNANEGNFRSIEIDNDDTEVNADLQMAGLLPVVLTDEDELDTFDTQTLVELQQAPIENILKEQIANLKARYDIPDPETDDSAFFRTITEDTVGYIKDLYDARLIEIFNKVNNIDERKIDLMHLLKKSFGRFFFSTAGTSMILFNRLDMPFVSAWQEYLEYLVEMDILVKVGTLKGWFRFI